MPTGELYVDAGTQPDEKKGETTNQAYLERLLAQGHE